MAQKCSLKQNDIVIVRNHPTLLQQKAIIIGRINGNSNRILIKLVNNNKKGSIDVKYLTKINGNTKCNTIKPRVNISTLFLSKLKKDKFNLLNHNLMSDCVKVMNGNCIYIKKFYDSNKSKTLYNSLKNDYKNAELKGILSKNDTSSPMVYFKNFKKDAENNQHNRYFSNDFRLIIHELCEYFDIKPRIGLLNYYPNVSSCIPFHKDKITSNKMNMTVGISFGSKRDLSFKHDLSGKIFSIPQSSGDVFAFTSIMNNLFRHSIQPIKLRKFEYIDRFSIIIMGTRNNLNKRNSGVDERQQ